MPQAKVHPRTLGYLGRALSLELSAVQQYLTQAQLAESWGLTEPARQLRQEVTDELEHTNRLVQRMLLLGVTPNASQLKPAATGRRLEELLLQDQRMEQEIIVLYRDAALHCARIGDREHVDFFEQLMREESQHAEEIRAWLHALSHEPTAPGSHRGHG